MEEEEDDFYGGGGGGAVNQAQETRPSGANVDNEVNMEDSEEDDDSDDDVQFTLEKPVGIKNEPAPNIKPASRQPDRSVSIEPTKASKSAPLSSRTDPPRAPSTAPVSTVKSTLAHDGKEGTAFPEIRTDKRDINATPTWPASSKSITDVDIDADLAEHTKPWRLPGTDQTDFFNYGFDEYTWTQYCVRQQTMSNTIAAQKQEDAQMKAFFGGGAGPGAGGGMPGMPPGMPMPDPQQLMEMVSQGVIPQEFAQQMMQMGGGMGGGGGGGGMPNQFQQGGGFGSGQNTASPQPQAGQGFQPPTGPSAASQGFAPGNVDGYSPQQLAIMQQEHQGGGGGRGRNRRGRGFY